MWTSRWWRGPSNSSASFTSGIGSIRAPVAPKPTSARYGCGSPSTSTFISMCVRGRMSPGAAPSTTRATSSVTGKPSCRRTVENRVLCS
ncbi:hypothetical protein SBADM41S_01866 [Streptomyces badius]